MSKEPTKFEVIVNEKATAIYTANLQDENGTAIGSGAIDSLSLTLSNAADGSIINSRNGQDALNANNVTVTGGGVLTFTLQPADTAILDDAVEYETHRATWQMQFNTVSFANWDIDIVVRNLSKVT